MLQVDIVPFASDALEDAMKLAQTKARRIRSLLQIQIHLSQRQRLSQLRNCLQNRLQKKLQAVCRT